MTEGRDVTQEPDRSKEIASERIQRELELNDIRVVARSAEGRRFLWRLLGKAGIFRGSFVPGQPDVTNFNEGQQNLGLWLLKEIDAASTEIYLKMRREAVKPRGKA